MTPERARAILKAGNASYGEYQKHMTPDEIAETRAAWDANPNGASSFYTTLCGFAARPGAERMDSVTRYVGTYVNHDGQRTLMGAAQGRQTYATAAEAQAWIDAVTSHNGAETIRSVWGDNPRFQVRPCPCYPGHFDPQTVWFD